MALLKNLLWQAARRAASDPRIRAKAADVYQHQVRPRAASAWQAAKPKVQAAARDLKDLAAKTDPREHPINFLRQAKRRWFDRD